jgi:hypothetical protein
MNQQTYRTSWRKGISLSATFLLALLVAVSCKKEPNKLGLGVLDPDSLLSTGGVDTFDLYTYTEVEDTFPTSGQLFGLIGDYNDPKFGSFKADFYTVIHPTSTIQFPSITGLVIDSVVLSFRYGGHYGKLDEMTFSVHRLGEGLDMDSLYYKGDTKPVIGNNLVLPSSETQTPKANANDSVMVGTSKQAPQLRLMLDPALGQELIESAFNGTYTNDETFETYFKGLRISAANASSNEGSVLYLDPDASVSRLTVYYTINSTSNSITYEVDGQSAYFNHVDIVNSPDVNDVITNHLNGQDQYYAQAFQSRAVVRLPGVDDLPKNGIVQDALLVIPIAHQTLSLFYPSATLRVGYYTTVNGVQTFRVKDVAYDSANKRYVIDIRDYVQNIVLGEQVNGGIYMYPRYFSSTAERIIFNGPNTTNKFKPKLIIKYTEY